MDVPIACALEASAARAQLDQWREILGRMVTDAQRPARSVLRLQLGSDLGELPDLIALAQRETACCRFFAFTLEIAEDTVALVITVPEDAATVLDDFAALGLSNPGRDQLPHHHGEHVEEPG